jgi:hypothetical protein
MIEYLAGLVGAATFITNEPIFKLMGIVEYTLFVAYIITKPENAVVLRDNHLAKPLRRFSDAKRKVKP